MSFITLAHYQARELLRSRGKSSCETSADLGKTRSRAILSEEGAEFENGVFVHWDELEMIAGSTNKCFQVDEKGVAPIQLFSETTRLMRTLYPTAGAPTTLVSGILMHRIKEIDPMEDTRRKIAAIAPVTGNVLDTATGLGYTALLAAKTAAHVITIEIDPAAHEIMRANPWSLEIFEKPNVELLIGDVFELIDQFESDRFSRIIHDPPTAALAGELYSGEFYRKLHRVLQHKGRMFHYVGDPNSAHGRKMVPGVIRRLKEAGFSKVQRDDAAFGVTAYKLPEFRR